MPNPTFPVSNSMPQDIAIECDSKYQENLIEFEPTKGETLDRPRYLNVPMKFDGARMHLTSLAQRNTLDTFFKSTIRYGSVIFDWKHPITQAASECKMKNLSIKPLTISDYEATFDLEVLP